MANGLATVRVGKTRLILNMPEIRSVSSSCVLYDETHMVLVEKSPTFYKVELVIVSMPVRVQNVDEAIRNFRMSYGLGIVMSLGGIARVELNYCYPLRAQRSDKIAPGLQVGVGLDFL